MLQLVHTNKQTDACYPEEQKTIAEWQLKVGKHADRKNLLLVFQCVGRSGEVANCTYSSLRVDSYHGCIYLDWNQTKTSKSKRVHIFAHRDHLELCAIHALACYFFSNAGTNDAQGGEELAFNEITIASAASQFDSVFRTFFGCNPDTEVPKTTGRGLRVAGANIIATENGLYEAILRGAS
jgi:hypothetical protein